MSLVMTMADFIAKVLKAAGTIVKPGVVHAHCDIPCGIYTPEPAQTAARTVAKMVEKLQNAEAVRRGFMPVRHVLEITGYCRKCRGKTIAENHEYY